MNNSEDCNRMIISRVVKYRSANAKSSLKARIKKAKRAKEKYAFEKELKRQKLEAAAAGAADAAENVHVAEPQVCNGYCNETR